VACRMTCGSRSAFCRMARGVAGFWRDFEPLASAVDDAWAAPTRGKEGVYGAKRIAFSTRTPVIRRNRDGAPRRRWRDGSFWRRCGPATARNAAADPDHSSRDESSIRDAASRAQAHADFIERTADLARRRRKGVHTDVARAFLAPFIG